MNNGVEIGLDSGKAALMPDSSSIQSRQLTKVSFSPCFMRTCEVCSALSVGI